MHVARRLGGAALLAALLVAPAWSQEVQPVFGHRNAYTYPPSYCPPGYPVAPSQPGMLPGAQPVPGTPPAAGQPSQTPAQPGAQPGAEQPNAAATPPSTDFGQASAAGSSGVGSAAPIMVGDLGTGLFAQQPFNNQHGVSSSSRSSRTAILPLPGRGAFKIDENEGPRPLDRVFLTYNYFNNVGLPGTPTYDLHREVAGFEKTFLDGNASIGMRFNIFQTDPSGGLAFNGNDFGDITIITKFALINDRETGNVLSGGLAVSVPTGPDFIFPDGSKFNPTLLQPFVGFIYNFDRLYLLGFSSAVIPTDDRDAVLLTNSLGLGYKLYQAEPNEGGILTSITPIFEAHLTDPLSKRGVNTSSPIGYPDILALTTGAHWGMGERSTLTTAIVTPVLGPRPYDFEAVVQLNFRF